MTLIAALIIAALEALGLGAPTPATRYVVFGSRGPQWLLLDVTSRRVERIRLPAEEIEGLAVSADGMRFAYTKRSADNKPGIWFWQRGDAAPRLIESGAGQYSDPALAPDGWIYFSRSPVNGRSHMFGTYAQVFRIRADGTGLEQITDENGCHFGVSFTRRGRLQYIHSSCTAQSWIERVGRATKPEILVAVAGSLAEAVASPDGRSVLFVSDEPDSFVVKEATRKRPPRFLFAIDRGMKRARVAYGRDVNEILYQQGGKIWSFDRGVRTQIAAMENEASQ